MNDDIMLIACIQVVGVLAMEYFGCMTAGAISAVVFAGAGFICVAAGRWRL